VNEVNGLVDIVLYLRGHALNPAEVTLMLGIEGTTMRSKGMRWKTSTNKEVVANIGLWELASQANSLSLSDHISFLKKKLEHSICVPSQIPHVEQVEISVFIGLASDDEGDGDFVSELTNNDLQWLASLGGDVSFKLTYSCPLTRKADSP
jgi:hypothetical protein